MTTDEAIWAKADFREAVRCHADVARALCETLGAAPCQCGNGSACVAVALYGKAAARSIRVIQSYRGRVLVEIVPGGDGGRAEPPTVVEIEEAAFDLLAAGVVRFWRRYVAALRSDVDDLLRAWRRD